MKPYYEQDGIAIYQRFIKFAEAGRAARQKVGMHHGPGSTVSAIQNIDGGS